MKKLFFVTICGLLFVSVSAFAEYDSKKKEVMNKESEELSHENENTTPPKQLESKPTEKVPHKLEDRENAINNSQSGKSSDQDRAGKSIEEKRDVNSDGPRADAGEDTPLETQKTVPEK